VITGLDRLVVVLSAKTQSIHRLRQLTHYAFDLAQCQQALAQTQGDVHQARALRVSDPSRVNDPRKPSHDDFFN
jgi:hypothetical protein